MSKLFIAFSFFFISAFSFSQEKVLKNELGISLLKVSSMPYNLIYRNYPILNFGIQAVYKRKLYDNFYFRANQSFYKYTFENSSTSGIYTSSNNFLEINTSSGFEYRYFRTKNKKMNLYS
ncbi:MAG: hypothetical protein ACKVQB_10290, partial [Bacteroidia bacterium]